MTKIDYSNLHASFAELKSQYQHLCDEQGLSAGLKKGMQYSVVKCFELCYYAFWRALKKYVETQAGSISKDYPIAVFRMAKEIRVIDTETQEKLIEYNRLWVKSAHNHDDADMDKLLAIVGDFIEDVDDIYAQMTDDG